MGNSLCTSRHRTVWTKTKLLGTETQFQRLTMLVNQNRTLTPYRHPILTPLCMRSALAGPTLVGVAEGRQVRRCTRLVPFPLHPNPSNALVNAVSLLPARISILKAKYHV